MATSLFPPPPARSGLAVTATLYALARLGLLALVTGLLLAAGVPLVLAVLIGLIVALPLSMVLFTSLRSQLDAALAEAGRRRSSERAALRARLRGEEPPGPSGEESPPGEKAPSDQKAQRHAEPGGG